MLQIDAEGAELEILRGADEKTLSKIRQIVMEVHDIEGRPTQVHQLLERAGFNILGTEMGMCKTILLYAARQAAAASTHVRALTLYVISVRNRMTLTVALKLHIYMSYIS